jgi:hypothetical protein
MLLRMAAVTLSVGTRKGAFALRVDAQRRHRGPAARPPAARLPEIFAIGAKLH